MDNTEHSFTQEEDKWAPLIGKVILDFANIEDFFHQVISFYLQKSIIKKEDLSEKFENQLALFGRVLRAELVLSKVDDEKLVSALKAIKTHRVTRNLVAHNSLGLSVLEDKDGNLKIGGFGMDGRKGKTLYMDYETLRMNSIAISKIRSDLSDIMMLFYSHQAKLRGSIAVTEQSPDDAKK